MVPQRHVEWLRIANAAEFNGKHFWFYPFKKRFLRAHAISDGLDLQIIVDKCWCGDGIWRGVEFSRPSQYWEICWKCNGTGVYRKRKVVLIRWLLNDTIFHEPSSLLEYQPHFEYRTTHKGLIKHGDVPVGAGMRAFEKLLLRYEPVTFYRLFRERWRMKMNKPKNYARWACYRLRRRLEHYGGLRKDEIPF